MPRAVIQKTLLVVLMMVGLDAAAATMYISDNLTVPLRRGPSNSHRIINAALPAGTPLEILGRDEAAGFTQVRLTNGTDGWVPTQYVTAQPVAKDLLAAANKRIQALEAELRSTRENYQEVRGARTAAESRGSTLEKQTQQLQSELAEIRRVSATAVAQYEENKLLKAENQSLQAQVTELSSKLGQLQQNVRLRWLMAGGALVLIGLAIGAWIKSRPKRSTWA